MSAIVTSQFRVNNASVFANPVNDSYYMFIGRPNAWPDEFVPDTPIDSISNELDIWDDIISMKRITSTNMSHAIRKTMWISGQYYDIYRHDYGHAGVTGISLAGVPTTPATLSDANYYVLTSSYKMYICLQNNNNAAASINPDTVTPDAHKVCATADGYVWKYIGKASTADIIKFSTSDYHPVKTLTAAPGSGDEYEDQWNCQVASGSDAGAIFNILVTAGGSGYGNNLTNAGGIATVTGDGTGCTVTVNTNGSGAITKVNITDYGSGYTWATVAFTVGTNATATAIITPQAGLGYDPVSNLNAFAVTVNARFEYDDGGDFTVANDFRRIGMLINPTNYSTSTVSTATTMDATTHLVINAGWTGTWSTDQIIEDTTTNARGLIVDVLSGTGPQAGKKILRIIRTQTENAVSGAVASASFTNGNTIAVVGGGASGTLDSKENPEVQPGSGRLIYIENRRPISRSADQIESISVTFEW